MAARTPHGVMNHVCYSLLLCVLVSLTACDGSPGSDLAIESASFGPGANTVAAGGAGEPTHWSAMSAQELWAHIAALDSTVLVGLKEPGQRRGIDGRGRVLVPEHLWVSLARQVEALGVELRYIDDFHPLVNLRLIGPAQIDALRRLPVVEYVEPASFDPSLVIMDSGCGTSTPELFGSAQSPGDIVPQTLTRHSVPEAWQLATGAGITIGIVDTGTSIYQPQLQQFFSTGLSAGRTITYDYSDPNGSNGPQPWHDTCGHGTKSLGLATAPRDGRNIVGVAYRANAHAVRALDDPGAGPGQWEEVRDGIRKAAEHSDIVNMAFGWESSNSDVTSTIKFYYNNENPQTLRKTLFIGAAGTHPNFIDYGVSYGFRDVIFPANLHEVVAVTGTTDGQAPCKACNYGDEVEFAAYTLGQTTGLNDGHIDGFGGSSGGTAIVSGIAALVWSRYPSWNRDQVLQRMRETAGRWGNRDNRIGYGRIDALLAVGGRHPLVANVTGPSNVYSSGTYSYSATSSGGVGPFSYYWFNDGSTGSHTSLYFATGSTPYTEHVSVRITDHGNGGATSVGTLAVTVGCPDNQIFC